MQVEKPQDEIGASYVYWGRTGRTGRLGTYPGVWTQFFFLPCAVTKLAQYSSAPNTHHWSRVLRIMRYLRGHESVRLCLGNNALSESISKFIPSSNLVGFFDASLMDCTTSRRSTGGYIFFYQGSVISWKSKKQGMVALSTTEAEYISGTDAAKELLWICNFLECIGRKEPSPFLLGDNKSALALAKNNDFRPRTKHIHARERFITDLVTSGQCGLHYVPTKDMIADAMTKALPREAHQRHSIAMNLAFGVLTPNVCYNCNLQFLTRNQLHGHIKAVYHFIDEILPSALCISDE